MHRVWCYYEPTPNGSREVTMTEAQILEKYYSEWCERMKKVGRDSLISEENCIQDWITINWAYPKV